MSVLIKELREGSLVVDDALGVCKVIGFYKDQVWIETDDGKQDKVLVSLLKPIPLTDRWIKKFGGVCYPWGCELLGLTIRRKEHMFWTELPNQQEIKFPYVHILQSFIAVERNYKKSLQVE